VLQPSSNYIYVKAFYNVLNYELDFTNENMTLIWQTADSFYQAIVKKDIEYVYSLFHMISCLTFKKKSKDLQIETNRLKFNQKIFGLLMDRTKELVGMCGEVC
jgi:hypothetical protein